MEELRVKSNNYAEENVNTVLKEAFAKVYSDGYRDGYKDRDDEIPVDLRDNKTEFVDLGLQSGTLWAKDFEKDGDSILFVPYTQAKRYNIPTREQWEELVSCCEWGLYGQVFRCTGKNGETLDFPKTGRIMTTYSDGDKSYLWLLEETVENKNSLVCLYSPWNRKIEESFMGYKYPIRLVR